MTSYVGVGAAWWACIYQITLQMTCSVGVFVNFSSRVACPGTSTTHMQKDTVSRVSTTLEHSSCTSPVEFDEPVNGPNAEKIQEVPEVKIPHAAMKDPHGSRSPDRGHDHLTHAPQQRDALEQRPYAAYCTPPTHPPVCLSHPPPRQGKHDDSCVGGDYSDYRAAQSFLPDSHISRAMLAPAPDYM